MFDIAPQELLLVAIVAVIFIGPKDLPRAMHFVGKWVGRARGVARQFRSGIDSMVREAELAELEKQWAAENERIMRQYPPHPLPAPEPDGAGGAVAHVPHDDEAPVMTPQPRIHPDPAPAESSTTSSSASETKPMPPVSEVQP